MQLCPAVWRYSCGMPDCRPPAVRSSCSTSDCVPGACPACRSAPDAAPCAAARRPEPGLSRIGDSCPAQQQPEHGMRLASLKCVAGRGLQSAAHQAPITAAQDPCMCHLSCGSIWQVQPLAHEAVQWTGRCGGLIASISSGRKASVHAWQHLACAAGRAGSRLQHIGQLPHPASVRTCLAASGVCSWAGSRLQHMGSYHHMQHIGQLPHVA